MVLILMEIYTISVQKTIDAEFNFKFDLVQYPHEEPTKITTWFGLNTISGYQIDDQSDIVETDTVNTSISNTSIFSNMKEAKAVIALAMLSQLLKRFNNERPPN